MTEQDKLDAMADAWIAVARLQAECGFFLASPHWSPELLEAFVEQAKQRLNVVALAVPFI